MIRIVGVQRNSSASEEFVLLQNQGSMRAHLRGHVLLTDRGIEQSGVTERLHVFSDDEQIPPGMYVLLASGHGSPRWTKTKEGALVYHCYMGREDAVWLDEEESMHILNLQHSFALKRERVAYVSI